jgi:hypothetical protein
VVDVTAVTVCMEHVMRRMAGDTVRVEPAGPTKMGFTVRRTGILRGAILVEAGATGASLRGTGVVGDQAYDHAPGTSDASRKPVKGRRNGGMCFPLDRPPRLRKVRAPDREGRLPLGW